MLCAAKENFWFIQHTARFIMYNFHIILFFSGKQKFTYCLVYVLLLHDNSEIKHSTNSIVPILSLYGLAKKKFLPIQNLLICQAARNSSLLSEEKIELTVLIQSNQIFKGSCAGTIEPTKM